MTMTNYILMGKSAPGPKEHCKHIVSLCRAWLLNVGNRAQFSPKKLTAIRPWVHWEHDGRVRTESIGTPGTAEFPIHPNLRFSPIWPSPQKQGDRKAP